MPSTTTWSPSPPTSATPPSYTLTIGGWLPATTKRSGCVQRARGAYGRAAPAASTSIQPLSSASPPTPSASRWRASSATTLSTTASSSGTRSCSTVLTRSATSRHISSTAATTSSVQPPPRGSCTAPSPKRTSASSPMQGTRRSSRGSHTSSSSPPTPSDASLAPAHPCQARETIQALVPRFTVRFSHTAACATPLVALLISKWCAVFTALHTPSSRSAPRPRPVAALEPFLVNNTNQST
mmetsp:Transcript_2711/g.4886  ORF Transcript_2711/g.4886 Transcript_2711/m.4886 type:complete len:240 (-) Transcript_2711:544-1263(-)